MDPIVEIAKGRHLRLVAARGWEYAERPNVRQVVVIVAVTAEDRLILVEQERIPVGAPTIELPAGLVGDVPGQEDEPLETAARRELVEETGYEAQQIAVLATCPTSPGLTSEEVTFVRAIGLSRSGAGGGTEHERITVHEVALGELDDWLQERTTEGAKVAATLHAGLRLAGYC